MIAMGGRDVTIFNGVALSVTRKRDAFLKNML